MTTLIVLVLLIGGGFLVYRYLKALEGEIRAEIESPGETEPGEGDGEAESQPATSSGRTDDTTLSDRILRHIDTRPGILQKELYPLLEDVDKKSVQQQLQHLERADRIVRNRSGNTYRLTLKN